MAEMVGDGDEVVFGIFGGENFLLWILGDFSSSVSLCPCVQLYVRLWFAGRLPRALSIASALLRRLICACGGRRAAVPHSCDCKTGPPSDVIHGPDVSWFGAFEWVWVPGDSSSCLQHLRCLAWPFLLAWRMGMATGDARTSLQTTVTA
jgi:hypothetical protein